MYKIEVTPGINQVEKNKDGLYIFKHLHSENYRVGSPVKIDNLIENFKVTIALEKEKKGTGTNSSGVTNTTQTIGTIFSGVTSTTQKRTFDDPFTFNN